MLTTLLSRRKFALRAAAIPAALYAATRASGAADNTQSSPRADVAELSHASEAIHQEIMFNADRGRVFDALTDSKQFDALTRLSDALTLVTAKGAKPTTISRDPGGDFTLFGGHITGRHLELVPGERLVQAWRAGSWKPGDYSIARFELIEIGTQTKLSFDHRGFPDGQGAHLAEGWHTHYWEPLTKFLSQS